MSAKHQHVKAKAEELFDTYALTTPVPVFELAQKLGIQWKASKPSMISKKVMEKEPEVAEYEMFTNWEEVLGYFDKKDNTFYINDTNQPITRMRFTMAHEIGHHQLHQHINKNHFRKVILQQDLYSPKSPEEIEANYFAGYLLMPDAAITKILVYSYLMPTSAEYIIKEFAKILAVSPEAMRIRLHTYKEENLDEWHKYGMQYKLF